jgi:hypothetical protein
MTTENLNLYTPLPKLRMRRCGYTRRGVPSYECTNAKDFMTQLGDMPLAVQVHILRTMCAELPASCSTALLHSEAFIQWAYDSSHKLESLFERNM